MSLFDRIFRPDRARESDEALKNARGYFQTLTAYRPAFTNWRGEIYESELVRAAIDARARHISKLKVELRGAARPALQNKLRLAPNQWQTWSQFLYRVSTILDATNTAFIVPVMDEGLTVTGYFPVSPERVEVLEYKEAPWLRYTFASGQTAAVELKRCAVLTKFQFRDDFFGSTNTPLLETMRLIHLQNQGIQEAIKNGATYRFIARVNNFTKLNDLAEERKQFSAENLSAEAEAGGLLLFPNTYQDIQQINQAAYTVDAEQRKLIQDNVFNYFGMNEKVLTNSAVGDDLDAFFNGAIEPFAIQFSEAMTMAIFTERERSFGAEVLANANRLQYMTTSEKVAMAQQLADRGALTINEIRELFNYAPLPGDAGNFAPIRGEYYDVTTGRSTEPAPAEEQEETDEN